MNVLEGGGMATAPSGPSTSRETLSQLASSPVVQAWELGMRLRQRREEIGYTAAAAGRAIGIIQAYVSGVEAGRVKLPARRLEQIVKTYELEPDEAAELEELRLGATRRGWWHEYAQLFPAEFLRFLGYEAGADHIRSFHPEAIHGLLQTEEYARAVIRGGTTTIRLTEVDRRVAVRLARQARLGGDNPIKVSTVLGEGALRQQVGGPAVMRTSSATSFGWPAISRNRSRSECCRSASGHIPRSADRSRSSRFRHHGCQIWSGRRS
ncbi:hypothetical protein GCM10027605_34740 [Micromonospora zhanjiangensis]